MQIWLYPLDGRDCTTLSPLNQCDISQSWTSMCSCLRMRIVLSSECSSLKRFSWLDLRLLEEAYVSPQPPLQENRFNGGKKKKLLQTLVPSFSP